MRSVIIICSIICAIGAMCCCYFLYQKNMEQRVAIDEQNKLIANCVTQIDTLKKSCVELDQRIAAQNIPAPQKYDKDYDLRVKKWESWCKLKHKLEMNEDCSEELKIFNELFAANSVVLKMVSDLISGEQRAKTSNAGVADFMRGVMQKIVKKIDHNKLYEISGYVLLDE